MSQAPAKTKSFGLKLENHYARLPGEFYTRMPAERVGEPRLLHANPKAAALIGLDPAAFSDPDFVRVFSGHAKLGDFEPLAMVYSGHQFGVWAGQLGDGRALLIGQARGASGELWDVQLKGAGMTPYSRFADGRAVMRSTIREYLGSEAIAALGIPTSRALSIIATGESVMREMPEPGAILTRLARSHVRFGHFEHFHHRGKHEQVRLLADHVIGEYFPDFAGDHAGWFGEVVKRTAELMADWMAAGFAHGVMNTDNMSILGLTLDYGPYGFLDAYDPDFICNHTDEGGRYSFSNQPGIGHWNLRALAVALSSLIDSDMLVEKLNGYEAIFVARFRALMRAKLGLVQEEAGDDDLIRALLRLMAKTRADYAQSFRGLTRTDEDWLFLFGLAREEALAWRETYRTRMDGEGDRRAAMDAVNPKYTLRNWVAETAIRAVEDRGDSGPLDRILKLVQRPYDEHRGEDALSEPPAPEFAGLSVSCSS
ncbi:MAG: YdiU family protein [Alphaproteobacteria bacterium]|nr:YdiU family protein [Alphaproteobacteria bacterium]